MVGALLLFSPVESHYLPLSPTVESRNISQEYGDKLIWGRNNIHMLHTSAPSPGLLAGYGYVAFAKFLDNSGNRVYQLDVLDADTGETLWQSEPFPYYEAIAISRDKAIVLLNEGHPRINIYDLNSDTSKPATSKNSLDAPTRFHLFPMVVEDTYYLGYELLGEYFLYEMNLAGEEISTFQISVPYEGSSLFLVNRQDYLLTSGGEYIWSNIETNDVLWRLESPGRIDSWPVFTNGVLVLVPGNGKDYLVSAIDAQTGQELWRTEETFGSNVVWHKDSLYVLRNDATLVELDLRTGQVLEEISFHPNTINAGAWAYWLASDGEKIYIYFGDSQELFALELSG